MIRLFITGGQTGVDRAVLDYALEHDFPATGWCPQGRWAEDGPIDEKYTMRETPTPEPQERTAWNARDSDATLAITAGKPEGGTAFAIQKALDYDKPIYVLDLGRMVPLEEVQQWLLRHQVEILNIAGPRESESPGIYDAAKHLLEKLFPMPDQG